MDDLRRLLTDRLSDTPPAFDRPPETGDYDLNPHVTPGPGRTLRRAGVLVPLIEREPGVTVLLTRRATHLPNHAGQISFPGGGVQPGDRDFIDAALREAHEEVGIPPQRVEVAGFLGLYRTVTDYCVLPVVGFVPSDVTISPDPNEVTETFEVPLTFLMNPDNHERHSRDWKGSVRHYYVIPYQDYYIWGATAAMLVDLYKRVFRPATRPETEEAAT